MPVELERGLLGLVAVGYERAEQVAVGYERAEQVAVGYERAEQVDEEVVGTAVTRVLGSGRRS